MVTEKCGPNLAIAINKGLFTISKKEGSHSCFNVFENEIKEEIFYCSGEQLLCRLCCFCRKLSITLKTDHFSREGKNWTVLHRKYATIRRNYAIVRAGSFLKPLPNVSNKPQQYDSDNSETRGHGKLRLSQSQRLPIEVRQI